MYELNYKPYHQMRDWVSERITADWCILSYNPCAINLLERRLRSIKWRFLAENPNGINLIEKNLSYLLSQLSVKLFLAPLHFNTFRLCHEFVL